MSMSMSFVRNRTFNSCKWPLAPNHAENDELRHSERRPTATKACLDLDSNSRAHQEPSMETLAMESYHNHSAGDSHEIDDRAGDLHNNDATPMIQNNKSYNDNDDNIGTGANKCICVATTSKQNNTSMVMVSPSCSLTHIHYASIKCRLLMYIILPLMLIFLLPTVTFKKPSSISSSTPTPLSTSTCTSTASCSWYQNQYHQQSSWWLTQVLWALAIAPLDRMRFVMSLAPLIGGCHADSLTLIPGGPRQPDLLEEESHMMLMNPSESGAYQSRPAHLDANAYADPAGGNAPSAQDSGTSAASVGPPEYAGQPEDTSGGDLGARVPAAGAMQARGDLPGVRAINVKCEKNHMTVNIVFDRPFYGLVFSKGFYNDQKCIHLPPNSGQTSVNFDIHLGKCGMTSSDATGLQLGTLGSSGRSDLGAASGGQQQQGQQPHGIYIENTIIIQYDAQVQEIYDQARKLRCTWYDYYEKSVTFRPYNVDMLDAVTANFLGDNIQCWMQIQVGKGPWSSEVAGIVKIGQTMTMVLAIKDDENRFDMLVRNCVAHDGKHQPIQLVDEYGCVSRPKIMTKFQKVRNFGPAATVVSFAHFQAFKFPDSLSVHFQCVIQVCRYECPEPSCQAGSGSGQLDGAGSAGGYYAPPVQPSGAAAPPSATVGADYATSGTELVGSKEPMSAYGPPMPAHMAANSSASAYHAHMPAGHHTHYGHLPSGHHQIKVDDSQGRVQVKLDTSMITGRLGATPSSPGPLPPHLMHLSAPSLGSNAAPDPQLASVSSLGGFQLPRGHAQFLGAPAKASGSSMHNSLHHPSQHYANGRPAHLGGGRSAQGSYSPPYPHAQVSPNQRAAYATNRMAELRPQPSSVSDDALPVVSSAISTPSEGMALSLIASPRALRTSVSTSTNIQSDPKLMRSKRATPGGHAQSQQPDSTSVKTHKTIQVVSPEDVAFSLVASGEKLGLDDFNLASSMSGSTPSVGSQPSNMVCMSPIRLVAAIFVTLSLLLGSLTIATYLIIARRKYLYY